MSLPIPSCLWVDDSFSGIHFSFSMHETIQWIRSWAFISWTIARVCILAISLWYVQIFLRYHSLSIIGHSHPHGIFELQGLPHPLYKPFSSHSRYYIICLNLVSEFLPFPFPKQKKMCIEESIPFLVTRIVLFELLSPTTNMYLCNPWQLSYLSIASFLSVKIRCISTSGFLYGL